MEFITEEPFAPPGGVVIRDLRFDNVPFGRTQFAPTLWTKSVTVGAQSLRPPIDWDIIPTQVPYPSLLPQESPSTESMPLAACHTKWLHTLHNLLPFRYGDSSVRFVPITPYWISVST
ncbi:hypothetical protein [Microcystis aeruginosa]|uniref:hypothetical protein n=1 Tax=Microcystis aeruginosa TaxID=1126 RepID=UPI001C12A9CB|nr:hypothetical protein [Microcystis aeruginosa]